MGYIEREAIMQKFADHVERSNNSDFAQVPTWNQAVQIVEDFPAADVRPVVHGRWVQTGGKYSRHKTIDRRILTCSVCGNFLSMDGVNAGRGDANYCPNCGADMREET